MRAPVSSGWRMGRRKSHAEGRPLARGALGADLTSARGDDGAADREAYARSDAGGFRGEEGFEDMGEHLRGNSRAVVVDLDDGASLAVRTRGQDDFAVRRAPLD